MKKCLIVLCSAYPFSLDDTFLETEIWFHEKNFEKIIIFATDVNPDEKILREIPANVECYNVSTKPQKRGKIGFAFKGMLNLFKKSDYRAMEKDAINGDIRRKVFLEYFISRASCQYRECEKILKNYDFSQYDGVMIYSYWLFISSMMGIMIKKNISNTCNNVKLITRAHRYDLYEDVNKLKYLPLRKYLLENMDAVFPCSVDGENTLKEKYPEYGDKIKHSYLGTFDKGSSRASENEFNIVSCARTIKVKRIEKIIDALSLLKGKDTKKITWTHIGDGEDQENVKKLAEEKLGFMDVKLVGEKSNSDVYEYYKTNSVDLFINTSFSEGVPVSIMEAISFGIPVLATDVGGVSEIIEDGYNGWLIDPDFTDAELAEKIKKISECNAQEIKKFRLNARSFWETHYDAENNYTLFADRLVDLLTS